MYMTNHGWVPEYHKIVKTNADRIRAMTDEELAKMFSTDCPDDVDTDYCGAEDGAVDCKECWLWWLKQEVDNG